MSLWGWGSGRDGWRGGEGGDGGGGVKTPFG